MQWWREKVVQRGKDAMVYSPSGTIYGGRTDGRKTNDRTDIWPKDIRPKNDRKTNGRKTQVRADNWPKRRLTENCFMPNKDKNGRNVH